MDDDDDDYSSTDDDDNGDDSEDSVRTRIINGRVYFIDDNASRMPHERCACV